MNHGLVDYYTIVFDRDSFLGILNQWSKELLMTSGMLSRIILLVLLFIGSYTFASVPVTTKNFGTIDLYESSKISMSQTDNIEKIVGENSFEDINPKSQNTVAIPKYWLRFEVDNKTGYPLEAYLNYSYVFINSIEIYARDHDAVLSKTEIGGVIPFYKREIKSRKPTARIIIHPGLNTYYIKVKYGDVKPPYFTLRSIDSFGVYSVIDAAVLAFFFGITVFSCVYYSFVYFKLRYRYILNFLLFVICNLFTLAFTIGLLGPLFPFDNSYQVLVCLNLSCVAIDNYLMAVFAIKFLNIEKILYPKGARIFMKIWGGVTVFMFLLPIYEGLFGNGVKLSGTLTSLQTLTSIVGLNWIGFKAWRKRYKPALYYLISWSPALLSCMAFLFVVLQVIPWVETADLWTLFGTTFQACVLSLAIGDRIRIETDALHSDLAEANGKLKAHVEHLDELVAEKTARIRYILENVNIGIFRFARDGTIEPEYSRASLAIFRREELSGLDVDELLFPNDGRISEKHDMMRAAFNAALGEEVLAWEVNVHALPKEILLSDRITLIELEWTPVVEENIVTGCLVIARDVTYTRRLEQENRKSTEEVNLIKRISRTGRDRVVEYIQSELETIKKTRKLGLAMAEHCPGVYDISLSICLRNLHTIKGNARTYGFDEVSSQIHQCESIVKACNDIRVMSVSINKTLDQLGTFFEESLDVINRYIPLSKDLRTEELQLASESLAALELVYGQVNPALRERVLFVSSYIKRGVAAPLSDILEPVRQDLPRISQSLGKAPPAIEIRGHPLFLRKEHAHKIRSLLIHLVRNSVDHGIETPGERLNLAKPPQGVIRLRAEEGPEWCRLIYEDDGQGLAIKRIHERAVTRGLILPTARPTIGELAELIFLPGFSSKADHEATEISGRGVGMDAVKDFLNEFKGTIVIRFEDPAIAAISYDQYRGLHVPFSFVIELPRKICA